MTQGDNSLVYIFRRGPVGNFPSVGNFRAARAWGTRWNCGPSLTARYGWQCTDGALWLSNDRANLARLSISPAVNGPRKPRQSVNARWRGLGLLAGVPGPVTGLP